MCRSTAAWSQRLHAYAAERDRLLGFAPQPFFVGDRGARISDCGARYNFALVCQRLGLRSPQRFGRHGRGPRIHDLRHSFAARTMIGWYRTGQDPAREMIKLTTYLGHTKPENTYWYIEAVPELLELAAAAGHRSFGWGGATMTASTFPALLQRFFTDRLCTQMEASANTIAGYRDTFRLLLRFASEQRGKMPTKLRIEDLDADLVADFLVHVETSRRNGARSRNTRLAAIRSFFRFVAMNEPAYLLHCQRILAMPSKRYVKRTVTFLDRRGDRGVACGTRSIDLGRPPGSRDSAGGASDRASCIRADQPAPHGRRSGYRRAYPMRGQGPQGTVHAASA